MLNKSSVVMRYTIKINKLYVKIFLRYVGDLGLRKKTFNMILDCKTYIIILTRYLRDAKFTGIVTCTCWRILWHQIKTTLLTKVRLNSSHSSLVVLIYLWNCSLKTNPSSEKVFHDNFPMNARPAGTWLIIKRGGKTIH